MTSDDAFWRLLLATHSVDDAILVWWLIATHADKRAYREPAGTLERLFGLSRTQVLRARRRLEAQGLVTAQVLKGRYTDLALNVTALATCVGQFVMVDACTPPLQVDPLATFNDPESPAQKGGVSRSSDRVVGQNVMVDACTPPLRFDPLSCHVSCEMPFSTLASRVAMRRRRRSDAIVLMACVQWCLPNPCVVSGREIGRRLEGLVDRKTTARTLLRLEADGLISMNCNAASIRIAVSVEALQVLTQTGPNDAFSVPGWAAVDVSCLVPQVAARLTVAACEPEAVNA